MIYRAAKIFYLMGVCFMKILVPTINDNLRDYKSIYSIYSQCITSSDKEIAFDFRTCRFLRQNAVAFLTALAELMTSTYNKKVHFDWKTCEPQVLVNLRRNGFSERFGYPRLAIGENSIPVRRFYDASEEEAVVNYLTTDWLGRGWMNLSEELAGAIIGSVWEIFANGFEHASSPVGIVACGQHYPTHKTLSLTVADLGVGIVGNVRRHLNDPTLKANDGLKWAIQSGNSTRAGKPGGIGLDIVREFIKLNRGEIAIFSREGFYRWFGRDDEYGVLGVDFRGTLVNLTLVCDERHYCFSDEEAARRTEETEE